MNKVIDGRVLAQEILVKLKKRLEKLVGQGIAPALAIILVGQDPLSRLYVRQKQKAATFLGIKMILKSLRPETERHQLLKIIERLNSDPQVKGILLQLPLPPKLSPYTQGILLSVKPEKDIEGFGPKSSFVPPVGQAVLKVLEEVHQLKREKGSFPSWLKKQKILLVGRGLTAGEPIARTLEKLSLPFSVSYSAEADRLAILQADIVIACVGKPKIIKGRGVKRGAIVIGVGIYPTTSGRIVGDLEEESVSKVVSFYTPTPGGIGPLTVAFLFQNLLKACQDKSRLLPNRV